MVASLGYDKISNCTKKELLHKYFSIFSIINESQNKTFIFVEHISIVTYHLLILNYKQKWN